MIFLPNMKIWKDNKSIASINKENLIHENSVSIVLKIQNIVANKDEFNLLWPMKYEKKWLN